MEMTLIGWIFMLIQLSTSTIVIIYVISLIKIKRRNRKMDKVIIDYKFFNEQMSIVTDMIRTNTSRHLGSDMCYGFNDVFKEHLTKKEPYYTALMIKGIVLGILIVRESKYNPEYAEQFVEASNKIYDEAINTLEDHYLDYVHKK